MDAVLIVGCGIAQAVALAFAAFATRDAFAALHEGSALTSRTALELVGSGLVAAICLLLSRRRAEALGQSYAIALRRTLYHQIAGLPKARHEARRVGALSLRFVGDLSAARLWFGRGLPDIVTSVIVLPGAIAILFSLDPVLARAGLLPIGLAILVMGVTAWRLERRHRHLRRRRANIAISMIERIAIAPELDVMGRTKKELKSLDQKGETMKQDAVARRGRTAGLQAILQAGVALAGLAILWRAGIGDISPATVAAGLSVLALVALPLQDLAAAWDRFCAWRIAREKARRLLDEPTLNRKACPRQTPSPIIARGKIDNTTVDVAIESGQARTLRGPHARTLARSIADLDRTEGLEVSFADGLGAPKIAYIGDGHVGLQGSLRRSACLMCAKRPADEKVCDVLRAFGLAEFLSDPSGLDQRIAENARGLTADETLRLDLARTVLGKADIIVIDSIRWPLFGASGGLQETLHKLTPATIVIVEPVDLPAPCRRN